MIQTREVTSRRDWREFFNLPQKIYQGDPNWVPPLQIQVRDLLDPQKNLFFKHARRVVYLAQKDSQVVGRIVGIIDDHHNAFHEEKTGFFGFFECVQDVEVAKTLLGQVAEWVQSQGMNTLRGPMNPSTNHECGLLVEGFNDPPSVMMTYNPRYYQQLIENCGFIKAKDLYAYEIDHQKSQFSEKLIQRSNRLKESQFVKIREFRADQFDQEVENVLEVYNDAWEKNWGFVPWDADEFRQVARDLKMIIDPKLCLIAEVKGEVAAFALSLPDINQALIKLKTGKLLPTGIFQLLWNLKGPGKKKTIHRCRIVTLGIKRAHRELALGPAFYTEYLKRGPELGYPVGEASWILEDNRPMNRALQLMGAVRTKVYRIFDRPLV